MKLIITIPKDKYCYIQELEQGNTDYATTRMLYHAVKHGKPYLEHGEWISEKVDGEEAQEPKTIIYSGDGYADGYMVYDMAECPSCGYEYEDGDKDWGLSFCPNCGQKLDWESEDKE